MQFNGISAILHNLNWLEFGVKFVPMRMNEKKILYDRIECVFVQELPTIAVIIISMFYMIFIVNVFDANFR